MLLQTQLGEFDILRVLITIKGHFKIRESLCLAFGTLKFLPFLPPSWTFLKVFLQGHTADTRFEPKPDSKVPKWGAL